MRERAPGAVTDARSSRMNGVRWYWHRLRAMGPREIGERLRKKWFEAQDRRGPPRAWLSSPATEGRFPAPTDPAAAPESLRLALEADAARILAGSWRAFGHLELRVDDPPRWHRDYLAGAELATDASAFRLDHRRLPPGADVKLIWELSRWHSLTRLSMAAYLLGDDAMAERCLTWLEDWLRWNPPYRGWNWTSALEVGLRLVHLAWIDALLTRSEERTTARRPAAPNGEPPHGSTSRRIAALGAAILPAHVWYAWRHRSFGSSANNHLLGELAGLIVATARWPALAPWAAPLDDLQRVWQAEVLSQFAEDGGNREQALNYHLFSFELCWQTRTALIAAGRRIDDAVEERLAKAASFYAEVQSPMEPWDYGDSDDAFVLPVTASRPAAAAEWRRWCSGGGEAGSVCYWLGDPPRPAAGSERGTSSRRGAGVHVAGWRVFPDSGIAIRSAGPWWLRWDLSPLGYLSTAAHGHLDALHLSIWYREVAIVVDAGTGAYYSDAPLREWLASRHAHNGPAGTSLSAVLPVRRGPFLWSGHHPAPSWASSGCGMRAEWALPGHLVVRSIETADEGGWRITDHVTREGEGVGFEVHWQFAPGSRLSRTGPRRWIVHRGGVGVEVRVDAGEAELEVRDGRPPAGALPADPHRGRVSPAFRSVTTAPFLFFRVDAAPAGAGVLRTSFLGHGES